MASQTEITRAHTVLERLEDRIDQIIDRVESHRLDREDARRPTANSAHLRRSAAPPQLSAVPPASPGTANRSLFEVLIQRLVKGYRGAVDEDFSAEYVEMQIRETVDPACLIDRNGTFLHTNPAWKTQLGFPDEQMRGSPLTALIDPEYRASVVSRITAPAGDVSPEDDEPSHHSAADPLDGVLVCRLRGANGTKRSVEMVTAPRKDGTVLAVLRDVSITTELVDQLRESRNNYDALSETITEAIVRLNEALHIVFANSAVKTTFGYEPDELYGRHFSILFPSSVYRRNEETFRKYFVVDDQDRTTHGLSNTFEILGHHRNRGVAPMEISFGNSKEFSGRTLTCIIRDITQRKNAERRLRHLAYHDQLTGLGNRELFENDMNRLLQQSGTFEAGPAALMFLDLDGFKQVNDTLGHDVGDELLIQTGKRLVKSLRESDSVYRFGGDEFVILLNFVKDRRGASVVAHSILAEIRRPFHMAVTGDGNGTSATVSVGVSIGISMLPEHGTTITTATKTADLAMYSSKEAGKNRFTFYDPSMDQRAHDRWHIEQGIRTSLEHQEFQMHYQPLVDIDGGILGFEALLRWDSHAFGTVSPQRIIAIAEESELIVPLGAWGIETAFREAVSWIAPDGSPPYVSVNLSPKQFERADLLTTLTNVITRTQIDPGRVIIEVTETSVMSAPDESIATLDALKTRFPEMLIAIDDFGTGYSSLSYLTRLPVDMIKIDLSFVSNLFVQDNEKIVQAILHLGASLGKKVVAEGVETPEQREFFVGKGCFAVQGYHFFRSVPAAEIPQLLMRGSASIHREVGTRQRPRDAEAALQTGAFKLTG